MSGIVSSIPSLRGLAGLTGTALLLLAACGPGTQPTAAPKPTTPPAPTAQAAAPTQAAPVAKPVSTAAPAAPAISITGPFEGEAKTLNAAGAAFPAPLYQKWFDEYSKLTGVQVNYQPIGSGGGIKSIQDQTVDFGASDAPMTDEQLQAARGGEI